MSKKISELSNPTIPFDKGSIVAMSEYDGVSAYSPTSKVTVSEFADSVFAMDAEQKITFDSSGTNKTFLEDSNSNANIQFNADSQNDIYINADNTYTDYLFTGTGGFEMSTEDWALAGYSESDFFGILHKGTFSGLGLSATLGIVNNRGSNVSYNPVYTNDTLPVAIGVRNPTFNSNVVNAVILGGDSVTADKSDYAFANKLELQPATETYSFEDAGSTGATEQDWIEVSVGGVTGYIRVYATK